MPAQCIDEASWLHHINDWDVIAGIPACEQPVLLLVLSDNNMLAYQAFQAPTHPVAFRRLPLEWTTLHAPADMTHGEPHPNAVHPSQRMQVPALAQPHACDAT